MQELKLLGPHPPDIIVNSFSSLQYPYLYTLFCTVVANVGGVCGFQLAGCSMLTCSLW